MKFYSQKWYKDRLGTCTDTISQSGCFITCLSMLAEKEPPEVNKILTYNGGYTNGCLLVSNRASKLLNLKYSGKILKDPQKLCIAETNHYRKYGVPQHFFIYDRGEMVDPLSTNPKWVKNKYNIVSYRLWEAPTINNEPMKTYHLTSELEKALEEHLGKIDGDTKDGQKEIAKKYLDFLDFIKSENAKLETQVKDYQEVNEKLQKVNKDLDKANQILAETIEDMEKKKKVTVLYSFKVGKYTVQVVN